MSSSRTALIANLALCFAVLGAASILLLTLLGALATPGYSHLAQFISELGASSALHEYTVRFAGFLPAGIFLLLYCVAAHALLPAGRSTTWSLAGIALYALGYLVASVLPCDPGCRPAQPSLAQSIHNLVGLAGYLAAPGFLFMLGRSAAKWPGARLLSLWGYGAAALALAGLLTLSPASPWVGLSQRVIEGAVLSWVVISGFYLRARAA